MNSPNKRGSSHPKEETCRGLEPPSGCALPGAQKKDPESVSTLWVLMIWRSQTLNEFEIANSSPNSLPRVPRFHEVQGSQEYRGNWELQEKNCFFKNFLKLHWQVGQNSDRNQGQKTSSKIGQFLGGNEVKGEDNVSAPPF